MNQKKKKKKCNKGLRGPQGGKSTRKQSKGRKDLAAREGKVY